MSNQDWATPWEFFHALERKLDITFDIDVCAEVHNAKCEKFITPEQDAFKTPWIHNSGCCAAYCNPPFKNPMPWMMRAFEESENDGLVAVMGVVNPSTKWWKFAVTHAAQILLVGGKRVQFEPPVSTKASSNNYENCVMIFDYDGNVKFGQAHQETWYWKEQEDE